MIKFLMGAVLAAVLAGPAVASTVLWQSRVSGGGGNFSNAEDYKTAVDAQMLTPITPGYGDAVLPRFEMISNGALFGANSGLAQRTTIDFTTAVPGVWDFRFSFDFGGGGAIFVDGAAKSFRSTDSWAGFDLDDEQVFKSFGNGLAAGAHQVIIYGLEGCCSGPATGQYRINGGAWTVFASDDGLSSAQTPEPGALGLLGAGLAAVAARRRTRAA